MIILLTFAILPHLLALAACYIIWSARKKKKSELFIRLFIGFLFFSAVAFSVPWAYTSIYFPYLYLALAVVLAGVAIFNKNRKEQVHDRITFSYIKHVKLVVIVLLALLNFIILKGKVHSSQEVLSIESPLKNGTYYVLQGGNSPLTNYFHRRLASQNYAIDIVRLNKWGNRASHIFSNDPADFLIFGDTVYSPVSGTITRMRNGLPDQPAGVMDHQVPIGNSYFIQYGLNKYLILGHLKKGSIWHKKGATVEVGTPLGLVGNSGRTIEPHLHLQAVEISKTAGGGKDWDAIPIEIDGRFYSINDRWKSGQ